jgi:polar amino acid transport system substrate-binding protein
MQRRLVLLTPTIVVGGCASPHSLSALNVIAPTGVLRAGITVGPVPSLAFAARLPNGDYIGPPADIMRALARSVDLPNMLSLVPKPNSGELEQGVVTGELDVAFLPPDAQRRTRIDFGPDVFQYDSTYAVRSGLGIRRVAEVDRNDLRLLGIAGTATVRAANASLRNTRLIEVRSIEDAIRALLQNQADGIAFGRIGLIELVRDLPGFVILEDSFRRSSLNLAVPMARSAALEQVRRFTADLKTSGLARSILERHGFSGMQVAPSAVL